MKLELEISPQTVKKIQALSVLTGKGSDSLTKDLESLVEKHVTGKILEAVGVPAQAQDYDVYTPNGQSRPYIGENNLIPEGHSIPTISDEPLASPSEEDNIDVADGLSDAKFEDLDTPITEDSQEDLIFNAEDAVATKDKDGNETTYTDPLMADLQAEAEDYEGDGQDSVMAAAAASHKSGGARVSSVGEDDVDANSFPDDIPIDEGGAPSSTPDILPVDLDLDKVSEGNDSAMDFFTSAMNGFEGDKSKRNQVKQVRRKS